jgi:bloom syndrome protein
MTLHNLAVHISWLLSSQVTPAVVVNTVPAISRTNSTAAIETAHAYSEEEDTEGLISSPLPSPSPNRRISQSANVGDDFNRPPLPTKITPKSPLRDPRNDLADESMGILSSASRSVRPDLVGQHQLATPASTTGPASSLWQRYSASLRKENGRLDPQVIILATDRFGTNSYSLFQANRPPSTITSSSSTNSSDAKTNPFTNFRTQS